MKSTFKHLAVIAMLMALLLAMSATALAHDDHDGNHHEELTDHHHSARCDNPDVCVLCGESCEGAVDMHVGTFHYEYDREQHWEICENCGQACFFMEHYVGCRQPGVCMDCGGPTDAPVRYHGDFNQATEYDLDHHWTICTVCGDTLEGPFAHEPSEADPSLCGVCGASLTVSLEGADISTNNPLNKLAIYRGGQLVDYTGFAKFDGEDFYFSHGVIDETKTGVVKLLDTWYAFDYGRVMRQEMMVPFEGGVFAFRDGTLNFNATGVMFFGTAEGSGHFLFSYGMFQPGVNGPWMDPYTGEWYYLESSVWVRRTDVVDFDGAKFYFVEGKLATWHTGYVTGSDGVRYYVMNGQVMDEPTVWVPRTGSKYHSSPDCSNMRSPSQVTMSEAIRRGYQPCDKCVH